MIRLADFADRNICSGSSSSNGGSNVGAIVGGTIGGVAGLIILGLLLLFFWRRRRLHRQGVPTKGRRGPSVDLLNESGTATAIGTGAGAGVAAATSGNNRDTRTSAAMSQTNDGRPSISGSLGGQTDGTTAPIWSQYRRGSAPSLPALNFGSEDGHQSVSTHLNQAPSSRGNVPPSAYPGARPETPSATETSVRTPGTALRRDSKQGGMMPTLRPVNIVQHDDAGAIPVPGGSGGSAVADEEILELPPTYQEVRRNSGLGDRPEVAS